MARTSGTRRSLFVFVMRKATEQKPFTYCPLGKCGRRRTDEAEKRGVYSHRNDGGIGHRVDYDHDGLTELRPDARELSSPRGHPGGLRLPPKSPDGRDK